MLAPFPFFKTSTSTMPGAGVPQGPSLEIGGEVAAADLVEFGPIAGEPDVVEGAEAHPLHKVRGALVLKEILLNFVSSGTYGLAGFSYRFSREGESGNRGQEEPGVRLAGLEAVTEKARLYCAEGDSQGLQAVGVASPDLVGVGVVRAGRGIVPLQRRRPAGVRTGGGVLGDVLGATGVPIGKPPRSDRLVGDGAEAGGSGDLTVQQSEPVHGWLAC